MGPAVQPLVHGRPLCLLRTVTDNGGPERPHAGSLALYGTFFEHGGIRYWWYPDAIRSCSGGWCRMTWWLEASVSRRRLSDCD